MLLKASLEHNTGVQNRELNGHFHNTQKNQNNQAKLMKSMLIIKDAFLC